MTCGLADGITIEWLNTGVEVRPIDLDMRAQSKGLAHAQFRVSPEAAEVIRINTDTLEPVAVKFDDNVSRRLMFPEEAMEHTENLDGNERFDVDIADPRNILQRGAISKTWNTTSLEDAVDYVMGRIDDPEDVITGYRFIEDVDVDESRAQESIHTRLSFLPLLSGPDEMFSGFGFDGTPPLEAMQTIMNEFQLDWWVDNEGVIIIAPRGAYGEEVATVGGENVVALKSYSITSTAYRVDTVQAHGSSGPLHSIPRASEEIDTDSVPAQFRSENFPIRPIVEANATTVDGSAMVVNERRDTQDLDQLEEIAERQLLAEIMSDTSGSMVVNGMASTGIGDIASMDVGDYIFVDDSINEACDRDLVTGTFIIDEVHHRSNRRVGWEITLEVTRAIGGDDIETSSFYYSPATDQSYEDLQAINEELNDNPGVTDG